MMDKIRRKAAYDKGVWSEELAARHMEAAGYEIVEARYKTKFGEIDLIARKGDMIAFIEVKARRDYAEGVFAVNYRARRRIEQAALHYISMHEAAVDCGMRFDVIVISVDKRGAPCVDHLDNAWEAGQ